MKLGSALAYEPVLKISSLSLHLKLKVGRYQASLVRDERELTRLTHQVFLLLGEPDHIIAEVL